MAVESFYFPHDYNARNDPKMVNLRMKEGMEGVGIFWSVVELLYEEGGFAMQSECERIAFDLRVKEEKVKRVVTNYQLFRSDETKFWSESVLRRIEAREAKSKKAKESALERWNKRKIDANALPSHSDSNAIKERKEKERIGKGISIEDFKKLLDDELWTENMQMIHKGKDLQQAIKESYGWLIANPARLSTTDQQAAKQLVSGWLSKMQVHTNGKQTKNPGKFGI